MLEYHDLYFYFTRILEGGFAAAAVLVSVGAILGKLNPFQLLVMGLIEAPLFVMNAYLGYKVLGVSDIGNNLDEVLFI